MIYPHCQNHIAKISPDTECHRGIYASSMFMELPFLFTNVPVCYCIKFSSAIKR